MNASQSARRDRDRGRLHTGDIAEIDADGDVRVIDRKKEPTINASGKNIPPADIEATIATKYARRIDELYAGST
jgi:long-subunit acyl-CoA synthetase (AMP-forming)